jgi:hypothetical protein
MAPIAVQDKDISLDKGEERIGHNGPTVTEPLVHLNPATGAMSESTLDSVPWEKVHATSVGAKAGLDSSADKLEEGEISCSGTKRDTATDSDKEDNFFDSLEAAGDPEVDQGGPHQATGHNFLVSLPDEDEGDACHVAPHHAAKTLQSISEQFLTSDAGSQEVPASEEIQSQLLGLDSVSAGNLEAITTPARVDTQEEEALARIKLFCTKVIATLAPPLLKEVESSRMHEDATPRRVTCSSGARPPTRKPLTRASAAENVLLKALGITPSELEVDEKALSEFWSLFNAPLQDQHLRVIVVIFGKVVSQEVLGGGSSQGAVSVH